MNAIESTQNPRSSFVYGPVKSWRFGRSLGIDPIGAVSTCSFNCVYCQLGVIQDYTTQRQIFVPTSDILSDLQALSTDEQIDVITLSGSGEPTLALNLAEILAIAKQEIKRPTVVLTNSTLLGDRMVRRALQLADIVAVKLDAISSNQLQRINQPTETINLPHILAGIEQFRGEYSGQLAIQTMLLSPWTTEMIEDYIQLLQRLHPDEIQLNVPARPRVLVRQLDARGNHAVESSNAAFRKLKCISANVLKTVADAIYDATSIPVRCAPIAL
ncbi:radical SAM protein [Anabaena sp. 4-3]|uniref:radical SAM protein n=1 Tax=Anabaena sp. 4-3 TaxID=1811979 RepID=UPI0008334AC4|nr:radical SAM protein [Anabaena sp. 4-3]